MGNTPAISMIAIERVIGRLGLRIPSNFVMGIRNVVGIMSRDERSWGCAVDMETEIALCVSNAT
jgi:hypothetical protein